MTSGADAGPSPSQIVSGVASVLASWDSTIWRRLLAEHLPDDTGRCRICRISGVGGQPWPCTLRVVAERAQQLTAELG